MSPYSHRDHRAFRSVFAIAGSVAAGTVALVVLAVEAPWDAVALGAVLGLAAIGGGSLVVSGAVAERYRADLRAVGRGQPVPGSLRVEVQSRVGFDRDDRGPRVRSPHVRRPRAPTAEVGRPEISPGASPR